MPPPKSVPKAPWFAVVFLLVAIPGCYPQWLIDLFVPEAQDQFARSFVALFQAREYDAIESHLDPEARTPELRSTLDQVALEFPADEPNDIATVVARSHMQSGVTTTQLSYEYAYPDAWVVLDVVVKERDGNMTIWGFHAQRRGESLAHTNRLTFEGKGLTHYLVGAAAIAVLVFTLWAARLCYRTPIPRRKWLWVLFVLASIGQFNLDWTAGTTSVALFSIQIPAARLMRPGPVTPWFVNVGIPLGAIVFLVRRRRWLNPGTCNSESSRA